ncbi:condensation domain-containing protein [Streptomyces seoulensis]
MTRQQKAVWAAQRLGCSSDAYNIPVAFRLSGQLDAIALDRALCELFARHPVLRSRPGAQGLALEVNDDIPDSVLRVHEDAGQDWSPRLDEKARTPFGADAPLRLSADLFRTGPQDAVLLLLLDHLAVDAPSVGLLLDDLSALYAAYADADAAHPGPTPEDGFFAYARTQLEYEESPEGCRNEEFWAEYVRGATAVPTGWELTTGTEASPGTASVGVRLPEDLRRRCEQRGITPFAALLGAFSLTLQHYFRTDDLLIGYPAVDWRRSHYPGVVGLYSEMLPFRTPTRQGSTADEYIAQVQDSVLDCLAHQGGSLAKAWVGGFVHDFEQHLFTSPGGAWRAREPMFTRTGPGSLSVED